jgi:hypothetical protein
MLLVDSFQSGNRVGLWISYLKKCKLQIIKNVIGYEAWKRCFVGKIQRPFLTRVPLLRH